MGKSDIFCKCIPKGTVGVRKEKRRSPYDLVSTDGMHSIRLSEEHRSCLEGVYIDLEQVRKVSGKTSKSDSTKTKRRHFVFDSSIDWKPSGVDHDEGRCGLSLDL